MFAWAADAESADTPSQISTHSLCNSNVMPVRLAPPSLRGDCERGGPSRTDRPGATATLGRTVFCQGTRKPLACRGRIGLTAEAAGAAVSANPSCLDSHKLERERDECYATFGWNPQMRIDAGSIAARQPLRSGGSPGRQHCRAANVAPVGDISHSPNPHHAQHRAALAAARSPALPPGWSKPNARGCRGMSVSPLARRRIVCRPGPASTKHGPWLRFDARWGGAGLTPAR